ncbi:2-dehydropantoate 2-reductase [Acinetobacter sp. A47]|uniref:2-dehydropantoate 2-reductase n=1 Tax=Acinetobacter sp. A47 TaxID=1561217 RepID=UPI00056F9165|nr:2-dehydropantoate 2-reductase [Acinetobacter sp. A47]
MKICIYGAGNIGCYLGGRLAAAGCKIEFIVRPYIRQQLQQYGLTISDYLGVQHTIAANQLQLSDDPQVAAQADLVFVCVKSAATAQVAHELNTVLTNKTLIISFQNGLANTEILKQLLPDQTVLAGMVPFNVAALGNGVFHQGTAGALYIQQHMSMHQLINAFKTAGLELKPSSDMQAIQWAKLILNLNNSVNALSQRPLKHQLSIREYRQCLAMAQMEALKLLKIAGIKPAQLTALPAQMLPAVLRLPDFIFNRVSKNMLTIDPLARSSMADDLIAGRSTEIDWINGEVVRLAQQLNLEAPVNTKLVQLVKQAENSPRAWSAQALKQALQI